MNQPTLFDSTPKQPAAETPLAAAGTPPAGGSCGLEARANTPPAGGPTKPGPDAAPHVIGLDPSFTASGIASSNGWCNHHGHDGITTLPHRERLAKMLQLVDELVQLVGHPDLIVIEGGAFARSAGGVLERAFLWWRLYERFTGRDIPIAVMSPAQRMMYATGKGSASKGAIVDAVARRWPAFQTAGDNNCADAVVLMAAGRDALGHPLTELPATHRRALETVAWPELVSAS